MSRACLGKTMAFIYKWLKKTPFSHSPPAGCVAGIGAEFVRFRVNAIPLVADIAPVPFVATVKDGEIIPTDFDAHR